MKSNLEIIAYKDGKRLVKYVVVDIYNGISNDYYNAYKKAGYKNINIRII